MTDAADLMEHQLARCQQIAEIVPAKAPRSGPRILPKFCDMN
jgi:hypothetical protein